MAVITVIDLISFAVRKGYKSKWILHKCRSDQMKLRLYDFYCIAKAYNHKAGWVNHAVNEFADLLHMEETLPNFYFQDEYKNHAELKRAFLEWKKKLFFNNETEYKKMQNQYFQQLAKLGAKYK